MIKITRLTTSLAVAVIIAVFWFVPPRLSAHALGPQASALQIPARLTDQQFWSLSVAISEPNGSFQSENLVSNEQTFQYVIPALERRVRGGVYLGVAPDQNFTYIVAARPKIAFIVDIRRGNLLEHLMYKALIELSADRADFLSRLFSKTRPMGLGASSPVEALLAAYDNIDASETLYRENIRAMDDQLVKRHGFQLSADDLKQLEWIYGQFFREGAGLSYTTGASISNPRAGGRAYGFRGRGFGRNFPSYEDLMEQSDWDGRDQSYLATEEAFSFLKAFEERNLIVPVVGNFAGPKAIRAIGKYVRDRHEVVTAFYVSNVEQYLFQDQIWTDFYRNVSTLPLDDSSVFIRSVSTRQGYTGQMPWTDGRATVLDPIRASVRDFLAGRIRSYRDLNARGR